MKIYQNKRDFSIFTHEKAKAIIHKLLNNQHNESMIEFIESDRLAFFYSIGTFDLALINEVVKEF